MEMQLAFDFEALLASPVVFNTPPAALKECSNIWTDSVHMIVSNCAVTMARLYPLLRSDMPVDPENLARLFRVRIASEDDDEGAGIQARRIGIIDVSLPHWTLYEGPSPVIQWHLLAEDLLCDEEVAVKPGSVVQPIGLAWSAYGSPAATPPASTVNKPRARKSTPAASPSHSEQIQRKAKALPRELVDVLDRSRIDGNKVYLPEQLAAKDYRLVKEALASLGGIWNKKEQAHVFADDATEAIEDLILTGQYTRLKDKNFDYFPTPAELVDEMIELAKLQHGQCVLEPSAGEGHIASKIAAQGCTVHVCEIEPRRAAGLQEQGFELVAGDFLAYQPEEPYTAILLNPPFGKRADLAHVMHAWQMLAPGGRLVAIMAAGITYRNDPKSVAFRELVESVHGTIREHEQGAFKASGTMVSTVTVALRKPL